MDSSLKLFLIGLIVGITTLFILNMDYEELWNDPANYFSKFLFVTAKSWLFVFLIIVVSTLPFMSIEPLRKRFTRRQFLPFPFLAGHGCAFLSLQIIAIIFEAIS